jgi:signal transduction histidine kinase
VSGRLIEAQEQERARIARELHDDTGQRLALLAVKVEQVKKDVPNANDDEILGRLGEVQEMTSEIANDVQALSHESHSSKLEYLGVVPAMRGFCREFGKQHKVEVEFQSDDVPNSLSPDISLCLFRVLQESLHNAAKHSGTDHFRVHLRATPGEIHLAVADSGVGFDFTEAVKGHGLGLVSMRERLQLVNGEFSIKSEPGHGTTIFVRVPFREGERGLDEMGSAA